MKNIEWIGGLEGHLRVIDQTKLPKELVYIEIHSVEELWAAIKSLKVRGAPAIGIVGAYGAVIAYAKYRGKDASRVLELCDYIGQCRPTAVNLQWALDRMRRVLKSKEDDEWLGYHLLREANLILEEDEKMCWEIGRNGANFIADGDGILTHCNAGKMATGGDGTALAVIYAAKRQGKRIKVYVDETRPLLQGARITAWELMEAGVDVTLICDNMAAQVMKEGKVKSVIVGADRIAANGDTANKIGTYGLSVLAVAHKIPLYVAAPVSTFDLEIKIGAQIPIEVRGQEEVTESFGRRTAPEGVKVYNPAFDVTPASNITAIITDRGAIVPVTKNEVFSVVTRRTEASPV